MYVLICAAGCSRPYQPPPGLTHCYATPVSWSCVCCIPRKVCIDLIFIITFDIPDFSVCYALKLEFVVEILEEPSVNRIY